MSGKIKNFIHSIRGRIVLPALIVIVSFASIMHFYWAPLITERQVDEMIHREHDVLNALSPQLAIIILNNDMAELYDVLDYQFKNHTHEWVQLIIRTPQNKQLYPIEEKSSLQGEYLHEITIPIKWGEEPVANMLMTFDMEKEINHIKDDILNLNLLMLIIIGIVSAGMLWWQEKTLRRPVSLLKHAARSLASGDFNTSLEKNTTSGEIGELINDFDIMKTNLKNANFNLEQTARISRENEMRQRSIVDNIAEAIITTDENRTIESFNSGAELIFGYTKENIIGNRLGKLIPRHPKKTLSSDNIYKTESFGQHKEGHLFPIELTINEMVFGDKKTYITIVRDITEEKTSKEALIYARDEAERASEAKSDFLSRMSHELRTPMNAILGFTQVLELNENEHLHGEDKRYIREISKAGHHLLELINEVLDLSKIESGKLELSMEPVSIQDVLEDCIVIMHSIANERNITLTYMESACSSRFVTADRTRMKQVILNLVSNAIKYNSPGGSVVISCEQQDDYIRFNVKDTGPGISEQHQREMFKPFNRLWAKHSTIEGVGIGLVITKSFIEKMGGHIGIDSTPGAGSTFWFELKEIDAPAYTDVPENITSLRQYQANRKNLHSILYIEDNPANLRLVASVLREENGIQILPAHEPHLGLEIARTHKPKLILLDINLPMMDGYEVLKILKSQESTKQIPVVAISANAMDSDIKRGIAAGFDDYIPKPIDIKKLQAMVNGYLMLDGAKEKKAIRHQETD